MPRISSLALRCFFINTIEEIAMTAAAGKFNPATLKPALEARFTSLLSREFAKGPLSDILTWLAGKIAEGSAADYIIGLMKQALQDWKLDAPGSANVS
jgi:hypothetical protein